MSETHVASYYQWARMSERRFAAPFPVTFLILEAVVSVTLAARVLQEEWDRLLLPLRVQRAVVPANVEDTFSMM